MNKLVLVLFIALTAGTAFGVQPDGNKEPSPEEIKQLMEASFGAMVPVMGAMTETMIDAQLKVAAKPETAERIAHFKKNLYKALVKEGFTKKEAMEIMQNTAVPAAMPGMK